jgi:hypothetical protein
MGVRNAGRRGAHPLVVSLSNPLVVSLSNPLVVSLSNHERVYVLHAYTGASSRATASTSLRIRSMADSSSGFSAIMLTTWATRCM